MKYYFFVSDCLDWWCYGKKEMKNGIIVEYFGDYLFCE